MPQYLMEGKDAPEFASLDSFTQGYVEALFWLNEAPGVTTEDWQATEDHAEGCIPGDVGFADLAPSTLAKIIATCKAFQEKHAALLGRAYDLTADGLAYTPERAGHDFLLTCSGSGSGFQDRTFKDDSDVRERVIGERLAALCGFGTEYPGPDVYLGDDGKVYVMGGE